jgi:hypothetical protein
MISLKAGGVRTVSSAIVTGWFGLPDYPGDLGFCPPDGAKHPIHCIETKGLTLL